jgi:hypothetical protein
MPPLSRNAARPGGFQIRDLVVSTFAGPLHRISGHLQAGAYGGYDAFFCLIKDPARMGPALLLIAQLYRVERLARSLTSEDRLRLRQLYSRGLLEKLHD